LESGAGSGRLKDGLDGDQQQLQGGLDQCRLQGKLALGRSREAEHAKTKQTKSIGVVFLQKKQEHGEAGTAKQGTERSL
jgi:hypothetical protein